MERALLRFTVETGPSLRLPRAETDEHLILLAFGADLDQAARSAVGEALDLIVERVGLEAQDAYRLCSFAVDLVVTQMVNGIVGVHAKVPKSVLATR